MFGPKICYPVCYHFIKIVCYVRHSRVSEYQIFRALIFSPADDEIFSTADDEFGGWQAPTISSYVLTKFSPGHSPPASVWWNLLLSLPLCSCGCSHTCCRNFLPGQWRTRRMTISADDVLGGRRTLPLASVDGIFSPADDEIFSQDISPWRMMKFSPWRMTSLCSAVYGARGLFLGRLFCGCAMF